MSSQNRNTPRLRRQRLRQLFAVFQYSGRLCNWYGLPHPDYGACHPNLSGWLLPAAIAYVGKLIVDTVVLASIRFGRRRRPRLLGTRGSCDRWLVRQPAGLSICQSPLRVLLGQRVNMLILEKALTLDLASEDSEFTTR